MSPLLYITLLTAVLLLMLYWVLVSLSPRRERRIRVPDGARLAFESAQELFKYLEEGEFYLPDDSIKLMPAESGHLRAYWHLSREKWQEILRQAGNRTGEKELVLRLHQGEDSYQEVPVKKPVGSYDWEVSGESPCNISLGIKSRDNYTPVLISSAH
jgi:hypothetical protein